MRLLPREEKFYADFVKQVDIISEAARLLLDAVRAGNSHLGEAALHIRTLEQKGDDLIHELYIRLNQTFITPLDPEDIHALASHLDDILDGIEEAAHRMVAYGLDPIPPSVIELCEIIVASCSALKKAFEALAKDRAMLDYCIEVNRLEDVADDLVRRVVSNMFRDHLDPLELMKSKEIHEILEQTTDRCEDVADVLQTVIVKNS